MWAKLLAAAGPADFSLDDFIPMDVGCWVGGSIERWICLLTQPIVYKLTLFHGNVSGR